jgi:5'-3' exonuclease
MIYIDGHNLTKRYYHGGGSPYGLMHQLFEKYRDKPCRFVCDGPKSRQARRDIYDKYKAGRSTVDDPIYWEVYNNIKEMALLYPKMEIVDMTWCEADDYIAFTTIPGDTVLSNDKDLWPLIDKGVTIYVNATAKVDRDLVEQKFNCIPKHVNLYKALVGDPGDKIPGKRGFGPAAWAKLDFDARELYTQYFQKGRCDYDPEVMTESACMSWKLASFINDFDYTTMQGKEGNVLAWIEEKGIVL